MLNKSDAEVVYDDTGKAVGVKSNGETAKCKFVVGDPSYFNNKYKKTGEVVRAMCILVSAGRRGLRVFGLLLSPSPLSTVWYSRRLAFY